MGHPVECIWSPNSRAYYLPDGEVVELPVLSVELLAHRQQPALRVQLEGAARLRLQGVGDLDSQKSIS